MKTKGIILSLVASTFVHLPTSFAETFQLTKEPNQAKNSRFELYPVKFSKTESKECLEFEGACLLPMTKKPVVSFDSFQYQAQAKGQPGIQLMLNERDGKNLEKATKKYMNSKLAVVHNGKVIMAPYIKSIIKGDSLELTFNDQKRFESVLSSFKGE